MILIACLAGALGCCAGQKRELPPGYLYPLEWDETGPQLPIKASVAPGWGPYFDRAMAIPITFNFRDMPFDQAVYVLRSTSYWSIVVDRQVVPPENDWRVTMKCDKMPFRDVLARMLVPFGLDYTYSPPAILISSKERILEDKKTPTVHYDKEKWRPLEEVMNRRISFDFDNDPLENVLDFLRKRMNVDILVKDNVDIVVKDGGLDIPRRVSLRVHRMQFKRALAWICYADKLCYGVEDGKIIIAGKFGYPVKR